MPETTLTPKSVRITEDEPKWLCAAATKGAVTQNDLLRLALHRLRKDLGAASQIKPETVLATAKASTYKLTPTPRLGREGASGRQAIARRGHERLRDVDHRRPPRSGHACSQELIAAHHRAPGSAQASTGPLSDTLSPRCQPRMRIRARPRAAVRGARRV